MKHTILILIAVTLCVLGFTQDYMRYNSHKHLWEKDSSEDYKPSVENIFNKTSFIFEGEVIGGGGFLDTLKLPSSENVISGKNYSYSIIKISNIVKGGATLKKGTIAVIDHAPMYSTTIDPVYGTMILPITSDYGSPPSPFPSKGGIYFCYVAGKTADRNPFPDYLKTSDNPIILATSGFNINYTSFEFGLVAEKLIFHDKKQVYSFIEQYGKVTIPKDTAKTEEPPQPKQTPAQKAESDSIKQAQNKLLYEQRKKNYEQYMESKMKIIDAKQKKEEKK